MDALVHMTLQLQWEEPSGASGVPSHVYSLEHLRRHPNEHVSHKTTGSRDRPGPPSPASFTSLLPIMKLAVILALVTLALYCSPASAEICQNFLNVIKALFLDTPSSYQAALEFFNPDADMKDAMIQLKSLVDTLPSNTTENILKFTEAVIKSPECA